MLDQECHYGIGKYWKMLLLLRWLSTIFILVHLRDFYALQILLLLVSSVIFQVLQISYLLMSDWLEYSITLFNELMVSLYLTLMLLLTDFYGRNTFRDEVGLALLYVVVFTVTVNLIKAVILDSKRLWRFIKERGTLWKA